MFTPRSFGKVGVEAYAAYALRAWLAREHSISGRTRRFAKWSAICSFALGMAGQVAYHLLAQAGAARAPWPVTTIVSCLPVLVLAMGTILAHMLRDDAGPATVRGDRPQPVPARSCEDQAGPSPDQTAGARTPADLLPQDSNGPAAGPPSRPEDQCTGSDRDRPGTPDHQQARSSGKASITAGLAQQRNQGFQRGPECPGVRDQRRTGWHRSRCAGS